MHRILHYDTVRDGLYSFQPSPSTHVSVRCTHDTWHSRLCHPHLRVLNKVILDNRLPCYSRKISKSCVARHMGKDCKFPLISKTTRSSHVLDLIFADVWGPAPIASSNGNQFFLLFTDDYSRYIWFFL